MRKSIFLLSTVCCLIGWLPVRAQAVKAVKAGSGSSVDGNSVAYSLPQTALSVYLTCEKETIKRGPYARFAQKYLGVVAPLSDKELYTLTGGFLTYSEEADPTQTYVLDNPDKNIFNLYRSTARGFVATGPDVPVFPGEYPVENNPLDHVFRDMGINPVIGERIVTSSSLIQSDTGFVNVPVDRRETVELSLEEMAAEAANTIFALRKRRFDLITGEAGENVFGAGLQAAIDEMKRLEDEYLALFLGKRFTERITKKYELLPEAGSKTYTVCRFSDSGGLLPESNLSGRPIILEFTPENSAQALSVPRTAGRDQRGTVWYRIADMVKCRLIDGNDILVNERIPIFQFGTVVEVPVTSLR